LSRLRSGLGRKTGVPVKADLPDLAPFVRALFMARMYLPSKLVASRKVRVFIVVLSVLFKK
jgi:hypothetical protein